MSEKILRIFDGIDRIGKTSCIQELKSFYERQGKKVKLIHSKDENRKPLVSTKEFKRLNSIISDYNEKTSISLLNYAYFFQLLFDDYDVILVDRLYMTFKVYAEVNRPGSIERVFTKQENFYEYLKIFGRMLKNIDSNIDYQSYIFTKQLGSTFLDDNLDSNFQQDAESLENANIRFKKEYFNTIHLINNSYLFEVNETSPNYFDTLDQFKSFQEIKNKIVI